ncbi:translation initiation factor IF-3 [Candidatus Methylomirabilis lanthanidiphila]|uniref:Translation initiation factor IF-3 n=1 Tax=Candidatus Methylomirabilis lanthanidiphila TaxID=2211376 RepID=A0A564ZG41_9BACT|nr:translation initiation factor IF-3 [Candidatus Methylomirabilis lanthanidiphila]VUZ84254.1 translation initiation factor IF-3 [Candidatus Methylomirabilis lanthanidiphila]
MKEGTSISRSVRVNERIRIKEVRVISPDGAQLGILPIQEALETAQKLSLDLVEVAPDAKPPVCRIMNYGKYRYEQNKKTREARKKQTVIQIKEIKLRPKTDEHDFQFKAKHAERFLKEGNKTKVTLMFRGREMVHIERGKAQLDRLAETLKEVAAIEQYPRQEGRNMVMILTPKHG